jgi:hypothetical protein
MKPTKRQINLLLDEKNWAQLGILVRTGMLDPNWNTPGVVGKVSLLRAVIQLEGEELAIQVIKAGAKVNYIEGGWSPLMEACQFKLHGVIDALINAGADVNLKAPKHYESGSGGHTALILAAEKADLWAVRRLTQAGADVNAVTRLNESALFWAGFGGRCDEQCADLSIAKELIKAGVRWRGNELHPPVLRRDVPMVKLFLNSGCDINGKLQSISKDKQFVEFKKGDTPLMVAVRPTIREITEIVAGPQMAAIRQTIQKVFKTKAEPTLASLKRRRMAIIKLLLKNGADPAARNAKGESALDIATRSRDSAALECLKKFSTGATR